MISSWDDYFHQVSWGLDKKCGFLTNGQFLDVGPFFTQTLVVEVHFWLYVYEICNPIQLNWIYDDFSSSFFLRIKITFFEICCIASLFVWKNVKFWPSFLQLISPLNWVKSLGLWGMQFFFLFLLTFSSKWGQFGLTFPRKKECSTGVPFLHPILSLKCT